jgi:anti-anti-sigma factor
MNPEPTWQYLVRTDGGQQTVVLSGEIDMSGASQLQELLQTSVRTADSVEIDVAALRFIDSTVISALIDVQNTATATGRRVAVINPNSQVRRVLAVTGVLGTLAGDGS